MSYEWLNAGLQAEGGCNGGEYGDDYFEDFTPDSFVFVFHNLLKFKFTNGFQLPPPLRGYSLYYRGRALSLLN